MRCNIGSCDVWFALTRDKFSPTLNDKSQFYLSTKQYCWGDFSMYFGSNKVKSQSVNKFQLM